MFALGLACKVCGFVMEDMALGFELLLKEKKKKLQRKRETDFLFCFCPFVIFCCKKITRGTFLQVIFCILPVLGLGPPFTARMIF